MSAILEKALEYQEARIASNNFEKDLPLARSPEELSAYLLAQREIHRDEPEIYLPAGDLVWELSAEGIAPDEDFRQKYLSAYIDRRIDQAIGFELTAVGFQQEGLADFATYAKAALQVKDGVLNLGLTTEEQWESAKNEKLAREAELHERESPSLLNARRESPNLLNARDDLELAQQAEVTSVLDAREAKLHERESPALGLNLDGAGSIIAVSQKRMSPQELDEADSEVVEEEVEAPSETSERSFVSPKLGQRDANNVKIVIEAFAESSEWAKRSGKAPSLDNDSQIAAYLEVQQQIHNDAEGRVLADKAGKLRSQLAENGVVTDETFKQLLLDEYLSGEVQKYVEIGYSFKNNPVLEESDKTELQEQLADLKKSVIERGLATEDEFTSRVVFLEEEAAKQERAQPQTIYLAKDGKRYAESFDINKEDISDSADEFVNNCGDTLSEFYDGEDNERINSDLQQERVERAAPILVDALNAYRTTKLEGRRNTVEWQESDRRLLVRGEESLNAQLDEENKWRDRGSHLSEDYVRYLEDEIHPQLEENVPINSQTKNKQFWR